MGRRSAEYERYIRSTKWRKRRARFACTHPKICTCGSNESLQLHHRSYERLGNELDQDLMWLCQPCHSLFEEYIRAGLLSRGLDEIKPPATPRIAQLSAIQSISTLQRFGRKHEPRPTRPSGVSARHARRLDAAVADYDGRSCLG